MRLTNKIHLYTTVLFVLLLVLINVAVYLSFSRMMYSSELEQTQAEAEQIVSGVNQSNQKNKDLLLAYVPINGVVQIVSRSGDLTSAVTSPGYGYLYDDTVQFYSEEVTNLIEIRGTKNAMVSLPVIWKNGEVASLQVTESLAAIERNLNVLRIVLIVVTLLAIIPLFISARVLSKLITRPITSMTTTMQDIRESGRFKRLDLPKKSKDELYLMGETFNEMIDLLRTNYERQEQFVSNASHELKTPLTVIESYSSLLKRRGKNDGQIFDESVEAIHSEAVRMKDLTEQLLLLAKSDEQWNVDITKTNLERFLHETIRSYEKAYKRNVELHIDEDLTTLTDAQKLKQLLYIFMDNARKYSEDGIHVRVFKEKDYACIQIIDHGIGIAEADIERVFDRFYRIDKARSRKSGGVGLGLALAKDLAKAVGAELFLQSEEEVGTKATIKLPLSQ
ncbi:HAMP domain-containing histidine kinase [Halobacillus shinanisalinarum]|uniref:histidine kinase n=1 Tax=Halobacillus shinanisalinarum TaxID=2932258 RepID=A0ABY4H5S9_9BACI|nr:ATP-binding protein [Halobacillus shinanisalinarum]UOQ94297.1 HAMP domain-containing histidine kinase [Halobacillus shinanisalinarum]